MGKDDFYKKHGKKLEERKIGKIEPRPDSFLIITEGEETEPNYFIGLAKHINEKYKGNNIDVKTPIIDTQGEGKSTTSLVRETERIIARSRIEYQHIWVLFDKDDFTDFDEAVKQCEEKGFQPGWSNQCFEYWLCLHFSYLDADLHRKDLFDKLNQIYKQQKICKDGYSKNDKLLFDHVTANGGLKNAIRNAEKIDSQYDKETLPSQCKPCTKVYKLMDKMKPWIEDLLK